METLNVSLGNKSYDIEISENGFTNALLKAKELAENGYKNIFISDENINKHHGNKLKQLSEYGDLIVLKAGECTKSFSNLENLCEQFAQLGLDRKGALFAVGGGVVGDLTGFAAAVYMRGVSFYQVPTTLLAMVDSSVGGKTGINIKAGKNLVGAFHQPKKVFIDTSFLKTLPDREFAAGMAELIKYALICDADFFEILNSEKVLTKDDARMPALIKRCCAIKADVVSKDEFETSPQNGRALLNLGHTFGHSIENCAGYGNYLHGEAVGIGMLLAALLSEKLGYAKGIYSPILKLIEKYSIPTKIDKNLDSQKLVEEMLKDKKSFKKTLRFVLMRSIGDSFTCVCDNKTLLKEIFDSAK